MNKQITFKDLVKNIEKFNGKNDPKFKEFLKKVVNISLKGDIDAQKFIEELFQEAKKLAPEEFNNFNAKW